MLIPQNPEILLRDEWHEVLYYRRHHLVIHRYFRQSSFLSEELYQKLLLEYAEVIVNVRPEKLLEDSRDFLFVVGAQVREWVLSVFRSTLGDLKIEKVAILTGTDFLVQLSLEQLIPEDRNMLRNLQYFELEEEALAWLG